MPDSPSIRVRLTPRQRAVLDRAIQRASTRAGCPVSLSAFVRGAIFAAAYEQAAHVVESGGEVDELKGLQAGTDRRKA